MYIYKYFNTHKLKASDTSFRSDEITISVASNYTRKHR